jgi:hypothetical protein
VTTSSWYGARPSTTYYFRVTAYNAAGESAPSNAAKVTTPARRAARARRHRSSFRAMFRWGIHLHARHGWDRPA